MDEQMTIDEYMAQIKPPEYGDRGCRVCFWHSDKGKCFWNDQYYSKNYKYPDCSFMPSEAKVPHMCASCRHSNNFIFEDKPEHKDDHVKSMYDPLEEPNIYCDHYQGSLNRRTAYKDIEQANFGVGHWHRQHEWDTCDRWEACNE